MEQLVVSEKKV